MFRFILIILLLIFCFSMLKVHGQEVNDSIESDAIFSTIYGMKKNIPVLEDVKFEIVKDDTTNLYTHVIKELKKELLQMEYQKKLWGIRYNGKYYLNFGSMLDTSSNTSNKHIERFLKIRKESLFDNFVIFPVNSPFKKPEQKSDTSFIDNLEFTFSIGDVSIGPISSSRKERYYDDEYFINQYYWMKDKNGDSRGIYFMDTKKSLQPFLQLLTKKDLKKLYRKNEVIRQKIYREAMSFEEVYTLMQALNNN